MFPCCSRTFSFISLGRQKTLNVFFKMPRILNAIGQLQLDAESDA